MAPMTFSTEVARPAEEVFAYVVDPSTMPEWQQGCVIPLRPIKHVTELDARELAKREREQAAEAADEVGGEDQTRDV